MAVTYKANANLALLKYWGVDSQGKAFLPSLSIPLPQCSVQTRVELVDDVNFTVVDFAGDVSRIVDFCRRFLAEFGVAKGFHVETAGNFPVGVGVASSAAGFAALAKCLAELVGVDVLDQRVLGLLAVESGSAVRSLIDDVVEWRDGKLLQRSDLAKFDLVDLICVVSDHEKEISSKELHQIVPSSVLFGDRLKSFAERYERLVRAMSDDDWGQFAELVEEEAWSLLLQAWSGQSKSLLLVSESLRVWEAVGALRRDGFSVAVSFDAGPTVHVLTRASEIDLVRSRLETSLPVARFLT